VWYKVVRRAGDGWESIYYPHRWEVGREYTCPEARLLGPGYHVCGDPYKYFAPGCAIFLVEGDVADFRDEDAVMSRIILVREINDFEYASVRCPRSGVNVGSGCWYAWRDARVSCEDGFVIARERSSVWAKNSIVEAFDEAIADVHGGTLYASGFSRVHARDGCQCSAFGNATASAHPGSQVYVGGAAVALECGGLVVRV
jgi:hypothetical protein